jgi:hypothetical protein
VGACAPASCMECAVRWRTAMSVAEVGSREAPDAKQAETRSLTERVVTRRRFPLVLGAMAALFVFLAIAASESNIPAALLFFGLAVAFAGTAALFWWENHMIPPGSELEAELNS